MFEKIKNKLTDNNPIDKLPKLKLQNFVIGLTVIVIIVAFFHAIFNFTFIETLSQRNGLKFLGLTIGGLLVIISLIFAYKRNNLTEENNLNTTFKDAVLLLGSEKVSIRMSGVYALVDMAKKNQETYAERINNVLCRYIVAETENKEKYNERDIQELIDFIIIKNAELFKNFEKDLSNAIFKEIKFEDTSVINVKFYNSKFQECTFEGAKLNECYFKKAVLHKIDFRKAKLNKCYFSYAVLHRCDFSDTVLDKSDFRKAELHKCDFVNVKLNGRIYNKNEREKLKKELFKNQFFK
ncbi:MAG: pentapeptide repeat-containing protein [Alphaproteobacteria bacterium]|jgi:uncharacterized protein YjbI with pentapeptide repeats|nr:pentapeptide repeat-containing protein [Alphaproteobacteria bacterium]